jgi:transposase-like protein
MKKARKQSSQQRWTRDTEKENYWKKQVELWQKSGLSVRAFCLEHGVVETSFYAWRRELIIRAREAGEVDPAVAATPNALKDGRGRTIPVRFRQTDFHALNSVLNELPPNNGPFVPLTIVPDASSSEDEKVHTSVGSGLTITTPSGYAIRLSARNDLDLLKMALKVLEDQKC